MRSIVAGRDQAGTLLKLRRQDPGSPSPVRRGRVADHLPGRRALPLRGAGAPTAQGRDRPQQAGARAARSVGVLPRAAVGRGVCARGATPRIRDPRSTSEGADPPGSQRGIHESEAQVRDTVLDQPHARQCSTGSGGSAAQHKTASKSNRKRSRATHTPPPKPAKQPAAAPSEERCRLFESGKCSTPCKYGRVHTKSTSQQSPPAGKGNGKSGK